MRRVVITGLGAVSPHGLGAAALWNGLLEKKSSIGPITQFDVSTAAVRFGGIVPPLKIADFVPKSYRKATKIMARDIELAVAAADFAVQDARLVTRGVGETLGPEKTAGWSRMDPARLGCNIGAGLICSDLNELTAALAHARNQAGQFSFARWGKSDDPAKNSGMDQLTPLWLLKYLPNMLACHVSIIHDAQGPSNTITCGQASAGLALAEACRTIQRGNADAALVGGGESKIHPTWLTRWSLLHRLSTNNQNPTQACRPLDELANGTALAEGSGVLLIEELQHAQRRGATIYAEVAGCAAASNAAPVNAIDRTGEALSFAMSKALRDAQISPADIQVVFPPSVGIPEADQADARSLQLTFGSALQKIWVLPTRGGIGDCAAGGQALDLVTAAQCLKHQIIPPAVNCEKPIAGLRVPQHKISDFPITHAMVAGSGIGGQCAVVVLRRFA